MDFGKAIEVNLGAPETQPSVPGAADHRLQDLILTGDRNSWGTEEWRIAREIRCGEGGTKIIIKDISNLHICYEGMQKRWLLLLLMLMQALEAEEAPPFPQLLLAAGNGNDPPTISYLALNPFFSPLPLWQE